MSLLDNVAPAKDLTDYHKAKILLIGGTGSGKTVAASKTGKVLYGITELQGVPAIDENNPEAGIWRTSKKEVGITSPAAIQEFRKTLTDHRLPDRYDFVVLDSLTDIQRIIKRAYQKPDGEMMKNGWNRTIDTTTRIALEVRDLPVHVIVTVISKEVDDNGTLVHRPALTGRDLVPQLGQFFNLVGFCYRRLLPDGRIRHEVMFRASEKYMSKGMPALRDIEPPEPLWRLHRRFGTELPDDVAARVKAWEAMAIDSTELNEELDTEATEENEENSGDDDDKRPDPFAS